MANNPIPSLDVIERDNNNTTDPSANQTGRTYTSIIPPKETLPKQRAPRADEDVTALGWIRKKKGPLA
jgi:hypothetical protein